MPTKKKSPKKKRSSGKKKRRSSGKKRSTYTYTPDLFSRQLMEESKPSYPVAREYDYYYPTQRDFSRYPMERDTYREEIVTTDPWGRVTNDVMVTDTVTRDPFGAAVSEDVKVTNMSSGAITETFTTNVPFLEKEMTPDEERQFRKKNCEVRFKDTLQSDWSNKRGYYQYLKENHPDKCSTSECANNTAEINTCWDEFKNEKWI